MARSGIQGKERTGPSMGESGPGRDPERRRRGQLLLYVKVGSASGSTVLDRWDGDPRGKEPPWNEASKGVGEARQAQDGQGCACD